MNRNEHIVMTLKNYFNNTGVNKTWFARKIEISVPYLHQILAGRNPIPKRCWKKIVEVTENKITFFDLLYSFFYDLQDIDIKNTSSPFTCVISLRDNKENNEEK